MTQKVEIDFVARGAEKSVSAWEAIDRAIIEQTTSLRSNNTESAKHVAALNRRRDAQKAANEAIKAATAIIAAQRTPQQDYLANIAKAKLLLQDGLLTQAQFTARQKELQQAYLASIGVTARKAEADRAAAQAMREARSIADSVRTAQQKYDAEVLRLTEHLKAGRLTQDEFSAAVAREKKALDDANGTTERNRQAQAKANEAVKAARAVVQSVVTPAEAYRAKLESLRQQLKAGEITQETFSRAVAKARTEFEGTAAAGGKVSRLRFDGVVGGLKNITTALVGGGGVVAAINAVIEANKRLDDSANQAAADTGPAFATLENQTGFEGQAARDAQRRVEDISFKRRIPTTEAAYAAAELAGANVNPAVATGGGLDAILETMNATMAKERQTPLMATEFSKAMLAMLKAQGIESPDAKQLRTLGKDLYALFKKTNLQAEDLANLGEVASTASNVMGMQEQLALYAQLREIKNPADAAVAFRQVSLKLQTARSNDTAVSAIEGDTPEAAAERKKKSKAAAASLGLKLEDVDLVGETVDVVVDRLRKAMANVKPEARMAILTDIVGEYAAAAFQSLINVGGDPIRQKIAMQQDPQVEARFAADARRTERLPSRVKVAQTNEQEAQLLRRYQGTELLKQQMTNALLQRDVAPISIEASQKAFDKSIGAGLTGDKATTAALSMSGLGAEQAKEIDAELKALRGEAGHDRPIDRVRHIGVDPGSEKNAAQLEQLGAIPDVRAGFARMQLEKALQALDSKIAGDLPNDIEKARAGAEAIIERRKADRAGALERTLADYLERFSIDRVATSGKESRPYRPRGQADAIAQLREMARMKERAAQNRDMEPAIDPAAEFDGAAMFSDGNEAARRQAAADAAFPERIKIRSQDLGRPAAVGPSPASNATGRDNRESATAGRETTARDLPDGRRSAGSSAANEAARQVSTPVVNVAPPVVNVAVDMSPLSELLQAINKQTALMEAEAAQRNFKPMPRPIAASASHTRALGRPVS